MIRCLVLAALGASAGLAVAGPAVSLPPRQVFAYEPAQQISLFRPSRLIVGTRSELRGVRWQRWGSNRAVGRGRLYVHDGPQGTPVILVASSAAECPRVPHTFVYTSLTLAARSSSTLRRAVQLFHAPLESTCYFGD